MCTPDGIKPALTAAVVSQHELVGTGLWRMALSVPAWSGKEPEPGQFIMLRVSEGFEPLLARPFGVAGFERNGESAVIEIIYRVVGRGTGLMARWVPGREASFLGPLGRGFTLPPEGSRTILVAGGVGLPPLLAMARRLSALGRAREVTLLYGESSRDRLLHLELRAFPGVGTFTCTEDGSCGTAGLVTDLLAPRLDEKGTHLFVCGPSPMIKAVRGMVAGRGLEKSRSCRTSMLIRLSSCSDRCM
ncbi:MAG: NAD-dependent dihydroorotate dehydrogenase B electron transfer subunit [bacterium]|nr:NAD-dependent dihydroorotate dehydrogenase B electron transfer subunit [bacterium]